MNARADEHGKRVGGGSVVWALLLGGLLSACLQQEDISADYLTSFEEGSPEPGAEASGAEHVVVEHHAMPPGAAANAAINGEDLSKMAEGGETSASASEERTSGAGEEQGAAVSVAHGGAETTGAGGAEAAGATGEGAGGEEAPVGVPEFHPHREMPPGYGSKLPPEPHPEEVPAPAASAAPEAVAGGEGAPGAPEKVRPDVLSPFEREFQGQKFITVSGTISYDGDKVTTVDIDCFVADPSTRAGRKLVNKIKVEGPGPYTMKVPADYGELYISSFMDLENNGPDSSDPQGSYEHNPLKIGDKDIDHVDIVLRRAGNAQ